MFLKVRSRDLVEVVDLVSGSPAELSKPKSLNIWNKKEELYSRTFHSDQYFFVIYTLLDSFGSQSYSADGLWSNVDLLGRPCLGVLDVEGIKRAVPL